jgi:broad specificity phosphatase PhoE
MSLPIDLVLIRHGQSEANVIQQDERAGRERRNADAIRARPDWQQRLTVLGREQAMRAGRWLAANGLLPSEFDRNYVSLYLRACETAALLDPKAIWTPEAKVIEREWGHYGITPRADRAVVYPHTEQALTRSTFFVRLDGGESIYDATYRVHDMLGTLARDAPDGRAMIVCHGELIWAFRFVLERLLPDEWEALDADKAQRIGNLTLVQYTRRDPETGSQVVASFSSGWRRIINPLKPDTSPFGGQWVRLRGRRHMSATELLDLVERTPRLLLDDSS